MSRSALACTLSRGKQRAVTFDKNPSCKVFRRQATRCRTDAPAFHGKQTSIFQRKCIRLRINCLEWLAFVIKQKLNQSVKNLANLRARLSHAKLCALSQLSTATNVAVFPVPGPITLHNLNEPTQGGCSEKTRSKCCCCCYIINIWAKVGILPTEPACSVRLAKPLNSSSH